MTQVGFKITISITCETEQDILAHLAVIKREAKKHLAKAIKKGGIPDGLDLQWEDDNCYGSHEVKIEPDLQ